MKLQDTQYTPDELAVMRGEELPTEAPAEEAVAASEPNAVVDEDLDEESKEAIAEVLKDDDANPAILPDSEKAEAPETFVPEFDGTPPANYTEQKAALREEKRALREQWSNGDLSDDEFASKEAEWEDKYEALQRDYLTSQALATANAQIQAQQNTKVLKAIADGAAKQGIDYGDEAVAMVYDQKLAQVRNDAEFAGKSFAKQAAEAHARVAKLFGKATTPPTNTPADGAKPDKRSQIPPTLSNMPAAAAPNLNQDPASDDLDMDPDLAEARWAQMPTSKRTAVLRATLPTGRR